MKMCKKKKSERRTIAGFLCSFENGIKARAILNANKKAYKDHASKMRTLLNPGDRMLFQTAEGKWYSIHRHHNTGNFKVEKYKLVLEK